MKPLTAAQLKEFARERAARERAWRRVHPGNADPRTSSIYARKTTLNAFESAGRDARGVKTRSGWRHAKALDQGNFVDRKPWEKPPFSPEVPFEMQAARGQCLKRRRWYR